MSEVAGPYFDDLRVGTVFDHAPSATLTWGHAATHQAIVGDRWRLALDPRLSVAVAGVELASPTLVTNLAIGQSTVATQRVRANLFYRRLGLLRQPAIGDTLTTVTTVVGLRENARREGRAATGLAALHMQTADQEGRPVLDFYRCAMIPLSPEAPPTGFADDLDVIGTSDSVAPTGLVPAWDHGAYVGTRTISRPSSGQRFVVTTGDVVSSAPELARLTLNVAAVHHDRSVIGERLVYGGHTISVAAAQACRALPDLATILAWDSCDHVGPVHEGDTLTTEITVESVTGSGCWAVLGLRAVVTANTSATVLDWRFAALHP